MKLCCLSHLLLVSGAAAWQHVSSSELEERLQKGQKALVAYVHPQEKHAQDFESTWTTLQQSPPDNDLAILSIDCSADLPHCLSADIASYPAIRLFLPPPLTTSTGKDKSKDDEPKLIRHRYRGPRTVPSIRSYLRRMLRLSSTPAAAEGVVAHLTPQNATTFLTTADDVVFLGRFPPSSDSAPALTTWVRRELSSLARRYRDRYTFGAVVAPTSASGTRQEASMECRNNVEGTSAVLSAGEVTHPGVLEEFVRRCAAPVIPEYTRRNELEFFQTGKSIVHFLPTHPSAREAYISHLRPLAQKYSEYLHFVTTDPREFPEAAEMLGLGSIINNSNNNKGDSNKNGQITGGLSVLNPNTGHVYPYRRKEKISAAAVEKFLSDIIEGKVAAWTGEEGHDEL
ncbi:hypothetical protein VTJ04DRAFT_2061 [Mycothermus thermophilus]|uniref:uncharacterized protein n=1 Tax=Humicola insolens TaxID=85995 RepID=UPI0037437B58